MVEQAATGPLPSALRDYAFVADGERGIMVGPRGEMAWLCFPTWDSPSVFSSLLGGPGYYQVAPRDQRSVWGGYYEPASLIWHDRWVTPDSVVECRDALALPAEPARAVVVRRVSAASGRARVVAPPSAGRLRAVRHGGRPV
jgi:alpha,alpha-trehalase